MRAVARLVKGREQVLRDIVAVYGVQGANYVAPLVTIPYLTRVLGPSTWGLVAMAQSFAMYGHLIVEYGFIYSATRDLAGSTDRGQMEGIVAGVTAARILLSAVVLAMAAVASFAIPLFREHQWLLWSAVLAEIVKAALPNYYFYGVQRVTFASVLDVSARVFALAGVFFLVREPAHAWRYFGLQGVGALIALIVAHRVIYSECRVSALRFGDAWRMLREGGAMFLFRSASQIYSLGNAFILGLFVSPADVGFYAGAEKINTAATGLLSPLSTALYPRAARMAKTDRSRAARLTIASMIAMVAFSAGLTLIMWFGAPLLIRLMLGARFGPSTGVLKILSLRAPLVAITYVFGFQWLLALGLERPFQKLTVGAIAINFGLAALLAARFSYIGMAWVVVLSQVFTAVGILAIMQRRGVNPFVLARRPANG